MFKKIIFNVLLNLIIISSVMVGYSFYKAGNNLMPIVCAAAFGLTVYYKIKLSKQVRQEMKLRAEQNIKRNSNKKSVK